MGLVQMDNPCPIDGLLYKRYEPDDRSGTMSRKQNSVSSQERRNAILQLFKTHRSAETALTISEVAQYLNSKHSWNFERRTYDRDIRLDMKCFTETENEFPERFFLAPDHNTEFQLAVTEEDAQLLAIALAHLKGTAPSTLVPVVSICETNLKSRLPKELASEFERFTSQLMVQYGIAGKPKVNASHALRQVLLAFRLGCSIRCIYHSTSKKDVPAFKKAELRHFLPIRFEVGDARLSILIQDLDEKSRTPQFKRIILQRMEKVTVTNEPHPTPDLKALVAWENSFGSVGGNKDKPVSILLEGDEAFGLYFTEREFHPSQKVSMLYENVYRVELEMPISGPLFRVLSGFSGNLHKVKPLSLKKNLISSWSAGVKNLTDKS